MASDLDKYNSDELEAPQWLNSDFLVTVLQNCEPNSSDLEVTSFKISPAFGKGDHFASVIFRANVDYSLNGENKSKSLIIKTMPELDGYKKDKLSESHIFKTEVGIYRDVLPRFEKILSATGDDTALMIPCLYYALTPRQVIVFEDMCPKGYKPLPTFTPSEEEAKAALSKLAKFHAVSYKLLLEEPKYFEQYRHNFFTLPNAETDSLLNDGIKNFMATFKTHPKLSKFMPYFEKLQSKLYKLCRDSYMEYFENPQPEDYYVLCHGDFHMKNLMVKHNKDTGKFEDLLLIDYQLSYTGPMGLDLIYFIYMVLDGEKIEEFPAYLYFYLTEFRNTLQRIGFEEPMPKMLRLREQMLRHRHLELFILLTFLPMLFAFRDGQNDMIAMITEDDTKKSLLQNDKLVAEYERLLSKFEQLGYFEEY